MLNRAVVVSSIIVSIISITRLLVVSNYQTPTAIALANSTGAVTTVTGTLVPLVPLFLPLATQLLAVCALVAIVSSSELRLSLLLATVIAFIATILVTPTKKSFYDISARSFEVIRAAGVWALIILFLISVLAIVIGLARIQAVHLITRSTLFILLVAIIVAVPTFVTYSFPLPSEMKQIPDIIHRMWLPPERIGMSNGASNVGYVLNMDNNWSTILWDSDRSVAKIKTSNILSRTICRIGPPDGLPLAFLPASQLPKIEPCELPDLGSKPAPLRILSP